MDSRRQVYRLCLFHRETVETTSNRSSNKHQLPAFVKIRSSFAEWFGVVDNEFASTLQTRFHLGPLVYPEVRVVADNWRHRRVVILDTDAVAGVSSTAADWLDCTSTAVDTAY